MLTNQELQSLRNLGNESEVAADEIARLRVACQSALTSLSAINMHPNARSEMTVAAQNYLERVLSPTHLPAGDMT